VLANWGTFITRLRPGDNDDDQGGDDNHGH